MKSKKLSPPDVQVAILATFFPQSGGGVMVDVGAARPHVLSNSAPYRARGWRIISIEPNPAFCKEHRKMGFDVIQCACSDENRDDVDFTVIDMRGELYRGAPVSYEAYSSLGLSRHYAEQLADTLRRSTHGVGEAKIKVNVRTLDTVLAEHAADIDTIDVLSIVAGEWELSVLRGFSIDRYRPKIVITDNTSGDTSRLDYMAPHGYWFWTKLGPREVFVRSDFRGPADTPPAEM